MINIIKNLLFAWASILMLEEGIKIVKKRMLKLKNIDNYFKYNYKDSIYDKKKIFKELEITILYRSGIKKFFPRITLNKFLLTDLIISIIMLISIYFITKIFIVSLVLSIIIFIIPIIYLNVLKQKRSEILSKQLTRFISIISKWAVIKDDIFYCFEKSLDQLSDPLKNYIEEFLLNVKYTGNISYAFDVLLLQSENEVFRNFVINIKQAEKSKGDLVILLDFLEDENYKIEAENNRRKSATLNDRKIIYFTMIGVFIVSGIILISDKEIGQFYFESTLGKYLITLYSILFFLGVYITSKITSFDY